MEDLPKEEKESPRNVIAFFAFGFCVYILVSVKFVIAEDVLADTDYPTTVVFICGMGPWFLTTLTLPHFIRRVPYTLRVILISLFGISGLLLISLVKAEIPPKLAGVCLTSLSCGLSAVTFIPLTAFYKDATVKAYTAGTGLGMCLGAFYYAGKPVPFQGTLEGCECARWVGHYISRGIKRFTPAIQQVSFHSKWNTSPGEN